MFDLRFLLDFSKSWLRVAPGDPQSGVRDELHYILMVGGYSGLFFRCIMISLLAEKIRLRQLLSETPVRIGSYKEVGRFFLSGLGSCFLLM